MSLDGGGTVVVSHGRGAAINNISPAYFGGGWQ